MRWPIRVQLLLPMLLIVVLAIVLATAASAYLTIVGVSRRQAEQLRRVVATLTDASFPLSETVLRQMSGLSGGQFVLLDYRQRVVHSTVRLRKPDLDVLKRVGHERPVDLFSGSVIRLAERTYFAGMVPITGRGWTAGPSSLVVLYPKNRWWAVARQVAYPIVSAGAVAMLVGMLVSVLSAGRLVRPIKALGDQATAIAAGAFRPLAVPRRNDEIADLTVSLNKMTERLSLYESEVRRSERLHTLGQLGAGIAHQLRNSATGARMAVELLQRQYPATANSQAAEVAMRQLRLMESYLQRFLTLGRDRPVPHRPVELNSVVRDVLDLVRPTCEHAKIRLDCHLPPQPVRVEGDLQSLRELLVNLVLNAIEAAGRQRAADARVIVELHTTGTELVVLRVDDSGPGPAGDVEEDLFEPFVSEKPHGTGLGLYVARQIAEDHQGAIRWQRRDDMTCFTVELPAAKLS